MSLPKSDALAEIPRLRARFESSKVLVARAQERALRAAQNARTMRALLEARHNGQDRSRGPHADIWEAAARELTRAAQERDEAFGVLSHELRQALSAALAAERLIASTDARTAERAREVLERQLHNLMKLMDTLLDFSRLSVQSVSLTRSRIDASTILWDAIETIAGTAADKQQTIIRTPSPSAFVFADPTRLLQVFSNLLHNAVRYTPDGGTITAGCTRADRWIRVTVSDDGEGIPENLQKSIFEPFVRGSKHGQGLGVGLPLAVRIVELHGGRIAVESAGRGHGSTFTVWLPNAEDELNSNGEQRSDV
jgi:two-component system, sensor histidine kinase